MYELVFTMTNVSVRSNVIILLINVRKVYVLVLLNLFYIKLVSKPVLDMYR